MIHFNPQRTVPFLSIGLLLLGSLTAAAQSTSNQEKRPPASKQPSAPTSISTQSSQAKSGVKPVAPTPVAKSTESTANTTTPTKVKIDSTPKNEPKLEEGKFLLRYKLKPGQVITSEVTHLAKTDTKIEKNEQSSQSRTVSQKVWQVDRVEPNGNMVFVYSIDHVDMSQQIGDKEEIKYNSKKDTEVPPIFGRIADSIGRPLSTVTIDARGEVVNREEGKATPSMGMGDLALVMPEGPISIGDEWSVPREIRVRDTEGGQKTIKIRELHTLEKVSSGIATISIRSQPITPISDPEIDAQVVQQLSNGTIRFDIDNGRLVSKELKWNEKVVGFSGAGSMMEYTARYSEEVKSVETKKPQTASRPASRK